MEKLKTKLVRLFTAYRTYLQDEDLVGAKKLKIDEWGKILDEALRRRTLPSEQYEASK